MEHPHTDKVPQETLDTIIDELADDKCSLKACCLVSRRWLWRSRKHLFSRVRFSSLRGSKSLRNWSKAMNVNGTDMTVQEVSARLQKLAQIPPLPIQDPFVCRNAKRRGSVPRRWPAMSIISSHSPSSKASRCPISLSISSTHTRSSRYSATSFRASRDCAYTTSRLVPAPSCDSFPCLQTSKTP